MTSDQYRVALQQLGLSQAERQSLAVMGPELQSNEN